jgi:hypothetical protein
VAGLNLSWDIDYSDKFFEAVKKWSMGSSLSEGIITFFQIIANLLVSVQLCHIVLLVTDSFIK